MLKRSLVAITFIVFFINSSFAATVTGAPDSYKVTLYEMALCSDSSCTTPKVIGSNSSGVLFDIASSSVGQSVGSFVDNIQNIDNGTYTHVKFTVGRSFSVSGQLSSGGTTYYTNNSGTDYTAAVAAALTLTETQSKIYVGTTTSSASKSEITTFVSDTSIAASSLVQLNSDTSKVDYTIALTSPLVWDDNSKYAQYALDFGISSTLGMSDAVSGTGSNWVSYVVAPTVSFTKL